MRAPTYVWIGVTLLTTAAAAVHIGRPGGPLWTKCHDAHWWIHCRNKSEVGRRLGLMMFHLLENTIKNNSENIEIYGPAVENTLLKFNTAFRAWPF